MRLLLLSKPLRADGSQTCVCCGRWKARTAAFAVPDKTSETGYVKVHVCTGCLRAALEVARDGRKREARS